MANDVLEELFPYYKPTGKQGFFSTQPPWQAFSGGKGCKPIKNSKICLRNDKTPPQLLGQKVEKVPFSKAPPPPKDNILVKMAKQTEEKQKEKSEDKVPPPFDIRDIPGAMRKMNFPTGTKLNQRWLDGRAHTEINRDDIFPNDMVDRDTITLSWLLSHPSIKAKYNALLQALHADKAIDAANDNIRATVLRSEPLFAGTIDTLQYCKGDIQQLHKQFQYQKEPVSTWAGMERLGMTDVTAALGNFAFYAAIAFAHIKTPRYYRYDLTAAKVLCTHPIIEITHVYVYAKDNYSFNDETTSSQYLGHWNKTGVIIVNSAMAASIVAEKTHDYTDWFDHEAGNSEIRDSTVDTNQMKLVESDVYYPVRNRNYRAYRAKHNRGGDFVIYSNLQLMKLAQPITIDLGEICA